MKSASSRLYDNDPQLHTGDQPTLVCILTYRARRRPVDDPNQHGCR
jgi:hypothetical protein